MASERIERLKRPKSAPVPTPDVETTPASKPLLKALDVLASLPPPKADKPTVTRKCGHKQGLADLEGSYCTACQGKRRRDNNAARRAKWEAKRPAGQDQADDRGRLPMGATFHVTFDADSVVWIGGLSVPVDGTTQIFSGRHSGVFKLLAALDAQYRAWAAGQGPPVEPTPCGGVS